MQIKIVTTTITNIITMALLIVIVIDILIHR